MELPKVLEWNIIKFMSHPCADIIKQAVSEAETYDDHFLPLNGYTFSDAYFQHYLLNNSCGACAEPWRDCNCWCSNCGRPCPDCRSECYDWDDTRLARHRRNMDRYEKYQYLHYEEEYEQLRREGFME